MTTAVYVDGFNLYKGLAKPLGCKWVNLPSYFQAHYPDCDIRRVYFFEALIKGENKPNQMAYIQALKTERATKVVLGTMKPKNFECHVDNCKYRGPKTWEWFEEKETDVKIAITMLDDAYQERFDRQILVTADSDLIPALRMIRSVRPKQRMSVCVPALDKYRIWGTKKLLKAAGGGTRANADLFMHHQFPNPVIGKGGKEIHRPESWREAPASAAKDYRRWHPDRVLAELPAWFKS